MTRENYFRFVQLSGFGWQAMPMLFAASKRPSPARVYLRQPSKASMQSAPSFSNPVSCFAGAGVSSIVFGAGKTGRSAASAMLPKSAIENATTENFRTGAMPKV